MDIKTTIEYTKDARTLIHVTEGMVTGFKNLSKMVLGDDYSIIDLRNKINEGKLEYKLNNELAIVIYNELKERFYNNQEIRIIIDKYKINKKDVLLIANPLGTMVLGLKIIKATLDDNLDVENYYQKFINIFNKCELKNKMMNDINYVPSNEELTNLMKIYRRRTNVDLIEILHCKFGQIKINYEK